MVALIFVAALAGGCGAESEPSAEQPEAPETPEGLVLKVEHAPGAADEPTAPQLTLALYGDGRVFRPDPQPAIYPAPALPTFSVARVSRERVGDVLASVTDAGLLDAGTTGDGPATVLTILTGSEAETVRLADGSAEAERLEAALDGLPLVGEERYRPHALAVFARPLKTVEPGPDGTPVAPRPAPVEWPAGLLRPGCSVVDGVALRHVLAAARDANELTHWRSGVTFFAVAFRPLVPGESTCAEIAG